MTVCRDWKHECRYTHLVHLFRSKTGLHVTVSMSVWQGISTQGDAVRFGACQYIFRKHWSPSAVLCSARSRTSLPTGSYGIQQRGKASFQWYSFTVQETKHHHYTQRRLCSLKKPTPGSHFLCESFAWSIEFHNLHFHSLPTAGPIPFSPGWRPTGRWNLLSQDAGPSSHASEGKSLTKLHYPSKGRQSTGYLP